MVCRAQHALLVAATAGLWWHGTARAQSANPTHSTEASSPLSARLECQPQVEPGRVLCEVELETTEGLLVWTDALLVGLPAFTVPLRRRIGLTARVMSNARRSRLRFALAAQSAGMGMLRVRGRAVVCSPPEDNLGNCRALSVQTQAAVRVGVYELPPAEDD